MCIHQYTYMYINKCVYIYINVYIYIYVYGCIYIYNIHTHMMLFYIDTQYYYIYYYIYGYTEYTQYYCIDCHTV